MNRTDKRQWLAIGAVFAFCVGIGAGVFWLVKSGQHQDPAPVMERKIEPPRPPQVEEPEAQPRANLQTGADGVGRATGRIENVEAANTFRARQPVQWFGDTDAGRARLDVGDTKTWLLCNAEKTVLGKFLDPFDQGSVGSCVGNASTMAVQDLILVQIARQIQAREWPDEYHDLAVEPAYAGMRYEIGKMKHGSNLYKQGDGGVGAWQSEWYKEYGAITREKHGNIDLTKYSVQRCRDWGRTGCPDELESVARLSPVKGVTGIRNAEEAIKAIQQGYPIHVCSNTGFASNTRDANGFIPSSGRWDHDMECLGYTEVPKRGFLFRNSWGTSWVRGPKGPHDIPEGCFWVEYATADGMFKQNDTWAFSDAVGFPARDPFFINFKLPRRAVEIARPRHFAADPKPDWSLAP